MAIIDEIPGLEVRILVDGLPLQEYPQTPDDSDDTETQATRYIVAEPGKQFRVQVFATHGFKKGGPKYDLAMWTSIDGKEAKGSIIRKAETLPCSRHMDYVDVDMGKGHAPIPTSTAQVEQAKNMGEIKVIFKRGTLGEDLPPNQITGYGFSASGKVHEKALKGRAMSRQAGLGAAEASTIPKVTDFRAHDKTPFATYKFLYRSMQDLKSEMIIPRSPSPTPLDELPDDQLTREQLLERLNNARETAARVKAEGQRIKRERSRTVVGGEEDDDEDGSDGIEVVAPPPKRAKVIESIDLTGD